MRVKLCPVPLDLSFCQVLALAGLAIELIVVLQTKESKIVFADVCRALIQVSNLTMLYLFIAR
jgi:hypothetical protein